MTRAVVFAYHEVGVRCLAALIAHRVEIPLVVTYQDDPAETIWFGSVADLARSHGIEVIFPANPADPRVVKQVQALRPDFIFSFFYRHMLGRELLAAASRGAFNMHGSLLPKYRGRVPINWAVIHGERETGATLHEMIEKPDAGRIVDQQAVPIFPNDTGADVLLKVASAAATVMDRALPLLIAGTAVLRAQDLARGSYYGGRRPEDGIIAWPADAVRVHNLVRAVAPPYPGAFCRVAGKTLRILKTINSGERSPVTGEPSLIARGAALCLRCSDGGLLTVLAAELDGVAFGADAMRRQFGTDTVALRNETGVT